MGFPVYRPFVLTLVKIEIVGFSFSTESNMGLALSILKSVNSLRLWFITCEKHMILDYSSLFLNEKDMILDYTL